MQPSLRPTVHPPTPTAGTPNLPSGQPSNQPSCQPTNRPYQSPTQQPSVQPSIQPSARPSKQPSQQPTRFFPVISSIQTLFCPTSPLLFPIIKIHS